MERQIVKQDSRDKGISGGTLKIIAIITMLIDHIGYTLVGPVLAQKAGGHMLGISRILEVSSEDIPIFFAYHILRGIGRLAFPIFCFLLVEGFLHTKNLKKYFLRLCIFAVISEIPFDITFFGEAVHTSYQNVFFTLAIGLAVLFFMKSYEDKKILMLSSLAAGCIAADFLCTDYGSMGIILIAAIYLFRYNKKIRNALIAVITLYEITAPISVLFIRKYNEKRGISMKYFFYIFYPAHLIILHIISNIVFR